MDLAIYIVAGLAFGTLVTAHVALLVGLLLRHPRWRAPIALVMPPLAPYWGYDAGMRLRTLIWVGAVCVYAVAMILAGLGG